MGLIIWLTGYPNSGKTTIAEKLIQSIKKNLNVIPVWIDGDSFRRILNISQNQTENERIDLGLKYARFAKEYCNQNHLVIVSTVAIYKEVYRELFNNGKENIQLFFIDADLEKRLERDVSKSIYINRTDLGINLENLPDKTLKLKNNSEEDLQKILIFLDNVATQYVKSVENYV